METRLRWRCSLYLKAPLTTLIVNVGYTQEIPPSANPRGTAFSGFLQSKERSKAVIITIVIIDTIKRIAMGFNNSLSVPNAIGNGPRRMKPPPLTFAGPFIVLRTSDIIVKKIMANPTKINSKPTRPIVGASIPFWRRKFKHLTVAMSKCVQMDERT